MREKGVDNIPIPSDSFIFKYHDHPLSLVLKDDKSESESETKICDACVTLIFSPPYYQCTSYPCTYFIHPICCFIPNTFHPNYQLYGHCHNYTLYALPKSKARDAISYWCCDNCYVYTNGMGYKCEECGKKIDVQHLYQQVLYIQLTLITSLYSSLRVIIIALIMTGDL